MEGGFFILWIVVMLVLYGERVDKDDFNWGMKSVWWKVRGGG